MSAFVDILLGLFYHNWIYIIIGAAVIITVIAGFGIIWWVYCSDRAKSYKVKPLPRSSQAKEEGTTETEEIPPCPAQSDLNLSALPPPVPELLRSMRRERSRQESIGGETSLTLNVTSSDVQEESVRESGRLVEDEGTIRREDTIISNRTTTLDRLKKRSEANKQLASSADQQDRPSRLELQRSMTSSKKVMTSSEDDSSSDEEDNVSLTTKREEVTKRLSASQRSPEEETPTIPFKTCNSFVYNKSPAAYRDEYRSKNGLAQGDEISSPNTGDVTVTRGVTTPRPQPTSEATPEVPKPRDNAVQPRETKRSGTHGIIRGRPRDLAIHPQDSPSSFSRGRNRVSVDDNRFPTQLSPEDLSPKHHNGPMLVTLPGQRDVISRDVGHNLYPNQAASSDHKRLFDNNRDIVRKLQNKNMDHRYEEESFSTSPKWTTAKKIRNTTDSTSRDVTTIPRNFSYGARGSKQANTVQAPWAHKSGGSVDLSRDDNTDNTSEDNLDSGPGSINFRGSQLGSVDGRFESEEPSDGFEFMEPTIYANQEARFYHTDL